ncbi:MAG: hypothetical protein RMJ55_14635 [Roseiflexaceae bacterium]|nr:hypothetical protein [Roseiflexaceae bacterium]
MCLPPLTGSLHPGTPPSQRAVRGGRGSGSPLPAPRCCPSALFVVGAPAARPYL